MKPKITFKKWLFIILGLLIMLTQQAFSANIYKQLTAIKCDSLIKANVNNPNFVILDVRTTGEYNDYHLAGAINRISGTAEFDTQLATLPKHKLYLLHCQSGGRSASAFTKMKNLNFSEVYEMSGGLNSWNAALLPTTTSVAPKLMMVSHVENLTGSVTDSIKITITNRGNSKLTFNSINISDSHSTNHNFNLAQTLEGPFDYTFTVTHTPKFQGTDSTRIRIDSNGGTIDFKVVIKNGIVVNNNDFTVSEKVIFPNPVQDRLFVRCGAISVIDEIIITNIAGKTVIREYTFNTSEGIDVSYLQNGIYIARIKTGQQVVTKKFLVKK